MPFRRATAKIVRVAGAGAGNVANALQAGVAQSVATQSSTNLILIGVVLVAVVAYFYFSAASAKSQVLQQVSHQPSPQQQTVVQPAAVIDPLETANEAYSAYEHASDSQRKCFEHNRAIQNYLVALAVPSNDAKRSGHICYRLASLYHQGVPETYVGDTRLPGVAPDGQQAIMYYREAIKFGYHGAVLPLAALYHWGLAGFEGNREVAMHLYGVALKTGNDYEKGIAKDRLRQMREEEGKSLGSGMLDEDGPISTSFDIGGSNPYEEHFMSVGKSPFSIGHDETTRGMDEKYVDDLINNKLRLTGKRLDAAPKKRPGVAATATTVSSDPQNARDHVVVNSAKQSLERLRANTHMQYDVPTTFKMIHEYITNESDASEVKRENAANVLQEMAKGIANLGYEQSKEIEALHLVWNRIHSQTFAQDRDKRKQLIDSLVNELAECIEYGELVCPTGRLNRIIDTLNYQDPIVQIQPQWAVRQMMVAKAGAIEKGLLAKCRSEVRDAVNATKPNARERQLQSEFAQKLRAAIEREMARSYVDTGLMTKELLKTELDAWML